MKLSCMDIDASLGCHFEATGDSSKEVAKKLLAHVKVAHPEKMEGMTDESMMKMLEPMVHE